MTRQQTASALISVALAMTVACESPSHELVAPARADVAAAGPALTAIHAGVAASGRADFHIPQGHMIQLQYETYSFAATRAGASPGATGHVEATIVSLAGVNFTARAAVTCISVVGNQAWIGSQVTQFLVDGEELEWRVGAPMVFRVQDLGEGHEVQDMASVVMFPGGMTPIEGADLAYCAARPTSPPVFVNEGGNIQVRE